MLGTFSKRSMDGAGPVANDGGSVEGRRWRLWVAASLGVAIFISPGMAQRGGGGVGTPARGSAGTVGPPNTSSNPDLPSRGIYLSGKVMIEGGALPQEPITIERVCNGVTRVQAYTDTRGHFSFLLGQSAGVVPDASEQGTTATEMRRSTDPLSSTVYSTRGSGQAGTSSSYNMLGNCELRAVLPGYRSDMVNLASRQMMDNPDVGTIMLHRLGEVEGSVISMTSLEAPKDAKKAYDHARDALKKDKLAEAEKDLRKAVEIYPRYAVAWYELGRIQQRNKQTEQARQSYAQALAADAKYTSPYMQLAELAGGEQNWADLADVSGRLLKLDPVDYPGAFLYNAVANFNLGKIDAAERSARAGQKLDVSHQFPKLDRVMAMVLARKKDYAGAADQMRSYLQYAPAGEDMVAIKRQLGQFEALAGTNQQAAAKTEPAASSPPPPPH